MKNSRSMPYTRELAVAKRVATIAGGYIRAFFETDHLPEMKNDGTPVTIVDKKINQVVITELTAHFGDTVVGEEESTGGPGSGRRWFCDPLDGTKAFLWGVPTALFSLALVIDGLPVLGVVYDPFLDRLLYAVKGQGAYCNGALLHVAAAPLEGSHVAISNKLEQHIDKPASVRKLVELGAFPSLVSGSVYRSCLVAKGRFVGYFDAHIKAHDIAAAHIIVEEAGGKVTGFGGRPLDYRRYFQGVIISNGVVHDQLVVCAGLL